MQMPFTGERYVPEVRGQIYYEHVHRYALAFELARDLDVLDIASGEGYGAAYLAIAARSVVGVDIDAESIRHAASRYTAMNLRFAAGSCTAIPLPDASMDLVVSFETLEHLEEHEQFMREIVRVLRPHGRLLISSPNKLVYSDQGQFHNAFHVRELYFDQFRDLLQHWFPHCRLYGQRIIAASAIHPLRGVAADARCIGPTTRADEAGLPALPAPAYFIALCFRTPPEDGDALLDSVFVDPRDDLLDDIVHPDAQLAQREGLLEIDAAPGTLRVLELPRTATHEPEPAPEPSGPARELESPPAPPPASEALEREIARLAALVDHLERELARAVEAAHITAAAAERQVAAAAEDAGALEQRAAAAEARTLAAENAYRSLESRLAGAQAALREAAAARAADGALVETLRAELARCRAEHADSQAQLAAVLRSTSWRVTKPIRAALRSFRRA